MGIGGWLRRLFSGSASDREPAPASAGTATAGEPAPAPGDPNGPVWCVAANVVNERPYGPGGAEVRRGTRHFAPGAKVYVFHFFWGMGGEQVTVVGRHRKSRRFITLIMPAAHLANWRAELVYSPNVIRHVLDDRQVAGEFARLPRGGPESRARAEEIAASYMKAGAVGQPFTTRPPGQPACRQQGRPQQ